MKKLIALFLLLASNAWATTAYEMTWGSPKLSFTFSADVATTNMATQSNKVAGCHSVDIDAATVPIARIGFRPNATTGTPAADSYTASLQAPGTDGHPSGTVLGGGTPASSTFTPTGTAWVWETLDNTYTATRGDVVCGVLERTAATDAGNFSEFVYSPSSLGGNSFQVPYSDIQTASTWTKSANPPAIAFSNADGSVVIGAPTSASMNEEGFGTTDEEGASFTVPVSECYTYTIKSIEFFGVINSTGQTYMARLYTTPTGTPTMVQETAQIDADWLGPGTADRSVRVSFPTSTLTTLNGGTKYGVALSASGGSNTFRKVRVATAADFNGYPFRQQTARINRTLSSAYPADSGDTGAFTETTTERPVIRLLFGECTAAAGGSSSAGFLIQ